MNSNSRKRQFTELYTEEDLIKKSFEKLSVYIYSGSFRINANSYDTMPESHKSHFLATNYNLKKIYIGASSNFQELLTPLTPLILSIGKNVSVSFLSITNLDFFSENLRKTTICSILNTPTITSLELTNPGFTGENFGFYCTHFSSNDSVKHLTLQNASIANFLEDFSIVLKNNTTMTSLTIADMHLGYEEKFVEALESNTTLTSLTLSDNRGLRYIYQVIFKSLSSHKSITSLDLSSTAFTHSMAESIAELITVNTTLSSLNLNGCGIHRDQLDPIFIALKSNTTLTCLNLEKNSKFSSIKSSLFEKFITSNTTLTTLNMKANRFSKKRVLALSHAFSLNSTLTNLNFSRTVYILCETPILHTSILSNPSLKVLELEGFHIKENTVKEISDQLKTNTVLVSLNLSKNNMRLAPCYLFDALKTNTTLTHLNISSYLHLNSSIDHICSLITNNDTLKSLNVFYPRWMDQSKRKFEHALSQNTSLVFFNTESKFYSKEKNTNFKNVKKNLTLYELLIHLVL